MINDKNTLLKNKELLGEDFCNQKTAMLKTNKQSKRLLFNVLEHKHASKQRFWKASGGTKTLAIGQVMVIEV